MLNVLIIVMLVWASVHAVQAERARQEKDWLMATFTTVIAVMALHLALVFTVKVLAKELREKPAAQVEPASK